MKTILIYLILLLFTSGLQSQDQSDYMMVMVKQKKAFKMARNEQDFQGLADSFERIANAESDQWHPLYYAGLCYINMGLMNKVAVQKDTYFDQAQTFIDRALEIYPDESEIYVLQALLYQGRIQVDPETRLPEFTRKAEKSLKVAQDYNPDNPRVYYLLALNAVHSPADSGGGLENACPYFRIAVDKFNTFRPDHVLSPTWGGERNQEFYAQYCSDQN